MKHNAHSPFLLVLLIVTVLQAGCGGPSPEQDAKRFAALSCKSIQLAKRAATGDKAALKESQRLGEEAEALGQQLRDKYERMSPEQLKAFITAVGKELQRCQ